jgi:hypothetical protein
MKKWGWAMESEYEAMTAEDFLAIPVRESLFDPPSNGRWLNAKLAGQKALALAPGQKVFFFEQTDVEEELRSTPDMPEAETRIVRAIIASS